jgi:hypothetical protein
MFAGMPCSSLGRPQPQFMHIGWLPSAFVATSICAATPP